VIQLRFQTKEELDRIGSKDRLNLFRRYFLPVAIIDIYFRYISSYAIFSACSYRIPFSRHTFQLPFSLLIERCLDKDDNSAQRQKEIIVIIVSYSLYLYLARLEPFDKEF
jgi:hypothetical protein